jgi:enoyl-CoA hydratase/carnithine racemase
MLAGTAIEEREMSDIIESGAYRPRVTITFDDYAEKYRYLRLERRDGVVMVQLHDGEGGPLTEGMWPMGIDLSNAIVDLNHDAETKVVIITGSGDVFCTGVIPAPPPGELYANGAYWVKRSQVFGGRLFQNLLDINVPVIGAVNGPAHVHSEVALLSDITLCTTETTLQDFPHFHTGRVPGDGTHIFWPLVLGINRARYFMLTAQKLTAQDALALGVVNEVLAPDQLLDRAWELGALLAEQTPMTLRGTRAAITMLLRESAAEKIRYGLTLEGFSLTSRD